jgi:hypothetical protein
MSYRWCYSSWSGCATVGCGARYCAAGCGAVRDCAKDGSAVGCGHQDASGGTTGDGRQWMMKTGQRMYVEDDVKDVY